MTRATLYLLPFLVFFAFAAPASAASFSTCSTPGSVCTLNGQGGTCDQNGVCHLPCTSSTVGQDCTMSGTYADGVCMNQTGASNGSTGVVACVAKGSPLPGSTAPAAGPGGSGTTVSSSNSNVSSVPSSGNTSGYSGSQTQTSGYSVSPTQTSGYSVSQTQTSGYSVGSSNAGVQLVNPLKGATLSSFLSDILSFVVQIGTVVVILMLVFVGYKFVAAQGNESQLTEAKKMLLWTLVGALVLLGAQTISLAIQTTVHNITNTAAPSSGTTFF